MERKLVATGTAALALAIAGCGSSGPLSRADFAKQASAICTHRMAQFTAAARRNHGNLAATMRAAYPALQDALDRLDELHPPAAFKSDYASVLAFERRQVKAIEAFLRTGRVPPGATEDGAALHRHVAMRARLGMSACNT